MVHAAEAAGGTAAEGLRLYVDAQRKLVEVKQMMMEMQAAGKRKEAQKLKEEAAKAAAEAEAAAAKEAETAAECRVCDGKREGIGRCLVARRPAFAWDLLQPLSGGDEQRVEVVTLYDR